MIDEGRWWMVECEAPLKLLTHCSAGVAVDEGRAVAAQHVQGTDVHCRQKALDDQPVTKYALPCVT